ncbi:MAG: tRNA lysidine(34) synthetase TilS [Ruminococcus sp.]|nr:tRNA lysidine(34) synthetase TilS [Ruminococcus sp.]
MNDFYSAVIRAITDNNMLKSGDKIVVALSGGADSVALFYVLLSLREKYGLSLYAAHVNHNLRGEESMRDESFVRDLCEKNSVELFEKSLDVKGLAAEQGIGTEMCGRNVRYEFFSELCEKLGAKTATAHTASDNAETVLFNLARGAGLNGMCGIQPVRGDIIRPLIYVTRKQVENYCNDNGLSYVTDSSNLTDDYTRNKIRHAVVPVLKEINAGFENNITNNSEMLRGINSFIELSANKAIEQIAVQNGYSCSGLAALPTALRHEVLYLLCKQNGVEPEYVKLKIISDCLEIGGAIDLSGSVRAVCKQGVLRFVKTERDKELFSFVELSPNTSFIYKGKIYEAECNETHFPTDRKLVFRTRMAGDKITLPKRRVTKTLKKFFNELKIPEETRDNVIVLADGSDILWAEGIGFSENGKELKKIGINIKVNTNF